MTREDFIKCYWDYYMALEDDFLKTERYVSFNLGDNFLYNSSTPANLENSICFSNEYIKQYQAICSEIDVLLKSICLEININSKADNMPQYTKVVLGQWPQIEKQKVLFKEFELQPFGGWTCIPQYNSPEWWTQYNEVKHHRLDSFKKANLKNTVNSLAALYVLECYIVKYIGDRDGEYDVPNNISQLFEIKNFVTREKVIGRNQYLASAADIEKTVNEIFNT